ncbi:MAG: GxxExxY protein [Bacteroidetes bacterium GWE2_29_8]|nr:MAG: GxxExxY protein [Bacteroidetes bacterium GWE2_29_8]OFY14598.1 MAG: GxxExxY protein [Bacteroidetes bacterium GWF2_29_10]
MNAIYENDIDKLTHKVIGCAMKVYSTLGNGFQKNIYIKALAIELDFEGIAFQKELEMPIFYREEQIGTWQLDFFVAESLMIELKCIDKIEDIHRIQAISYLEAYNIADGLLINFGNTNLEFKRVYNKKLIAKENLKYKLD